MLQKSLSCLFYCTNLIKIFRWMGITQFSMCNTKEKQNVSGSSRNLLRSWLSRYVRFQRLFPSLGRYTDLLQDVGDVGRKGRRHPFVLSCNECRTYYTVNGTPSSRLDRVSIELVTYEIYSKVRRITFFE